MVAYARASNWVQLLPAHPLSLAFPSVCRRKMHERLLRHLFVSFLAKSRRAWLDGAPSWPDQWLGPFTAHSQGP